MKKAVDEDYRSGRFLLIGSANVLTLPRIADQAPSPARAARQLDGAICNEA